MSGNSLESLLNRMKEGSVTQGWGAVSVFNRGRLNRLLEQQYIARFNGLGFMPSFNGSLQLTDDGNEVVELNNVSLGQPLLSFNTASLINSSAVLTMNLIAGHYTVSRQQPGAQKVLLSTFNITEAQGFTLVMDIDLSLVVGEIDRQGKVTLNLSEAANFRCNLAGDDEATNTRLASVFKESFAALPAHRSVYQLGMLNLKGYNHLTPKSFRIVTQAAPGAKVRSALNYGDGGVVVLIQLQGNTGPGRFPLTNDFPFLIPDDTEANGSDRYSASLVLSKDMTPYVEGNNLEVLNNLLFPAENFFDERERHKPGDNDLAVFGNISPKQTLITLDPAFKTIKAGGDPQRFTLRNWKGEGIQGSNWRAVGLRSHTAESQGTIADGLYTPASSALIGHDSLHVVVTADYVNAGITYTASALLLVVFDSMTIAPRMATCSTTAQSQAVVLSASALDAAPVSWKLLAPEYGTLTQSANRGLFTADNRARSKGLAVQRIEATGTETRQASLLLVNAEQLLRVEPPYVPAVRQSAGVQLKDDPTLLPGVPRRWKVIGGGGTVDARGHFTAPAQGTTHSTVVHCEIVRNGVVFSSGYSVIDLSELEPEPSWDSLVKFTVVVPNGLDQGRLGSMYTNGYQQLITEIRVETSSSEGKARALSVSEKASMRLVTNSSDAEIEFVDGDGIPEGDARAWATNLKVNRFEMPIPGLAAQDCTRGTEPGAFSADPPPISNVVLYLHTREKAGSPATFYATFQADRDNFWHRSTHITDINNKITITPLPIPMFIDEDYTFKRARIDGGSGNPGDPEDDDFDFHLRTVDYWTLGYVGRPGTQGATFETLEFLSVDGNDIPVAASESTIRWESEQLAETMFSWTGSIFQDRLEPDSIAKIKFDEATKFVVKHESLDVDVDRGSFEHGRLVISLHRSDRIPYIRETDTSRAKLSRDLAVLLRDKNGNAHRRRITYLPSSVVGDRNRLKHILFTPSS